MEMFEVVDVGVDFMGDVVEVPAVNEAVKLRIDDACIECKRRFGRVDLQWIANSAKVSQEKIISELRGTAIFQDPELLIDETEWDAFFGWEFAEQYLCGNIAKKLEIALEMEKRFPNCFRENVEKLKKLLPEKVMFNEINTPFGANWVPSEVYVEFFKTLFNVRGKIMLHYIVGLSKWKVLGDSGILNSLPNLVTYGTDRIDAVHIIEKTMNAASVKIYDYVNCNLTSSASNKRIPNKRATLEAQEKQRLIVDRWNNWLQANTNVQKIIQESYNDQFVGYAYSPFDGSFLTFDDLNPEIKLYKHQKDAVARALLSSNNLLLAHEVGSGKTYEMIVIAHESKRMGISDKNMIVLPNNVLGDAINAHKLLYPNDRILTVFPKDFAPAYRNKVLKEIRDGDYVAIYMACSSFDMVKMSKQWWMNHKHNEIKDLKNAALNSVDKIEKRALKSKIQALEKSLEKYIRDGRDTPWMCFDELGVTTLMVDEAHHYKNISFDTRCDGIVGIHKSGSKKANEMMAKCHYEGVKKVIFSTGTPLTNSIADLYVFQKFLQPNELKLHGLNTFDSWVNTFATREESVEIDIDSSTLRTMVRFSKFHNLTELMSLFSSVCDFHFNDEENGLPKWNGYIDISSEKTPFQSEYISELMLRTEDLRKGKISKSEDNALKICSDGRKSALDDRLVSEEACNYHYEFRKVNKCANIIKEFYDKFPNTAQVVFSDIGTPKAEFNIYDSLKSELENLGIPSFEIAFIHDATSEKQRKLLFKQINSGVVRVIIGSTSKLGIGTNFQERLICAHHLSIPWRPSDLVQRNGRILRQFNSCDEVFIFRYITPGTFDSYSWQLLESKERFISSFLSGSCKNREAVDIGETVLSYSEIKAACIGNKLVKRRVETSNLIQRKKILSSQRQGELFKAAALVEKLPEKIQKLKEHRQIVEKDELLYKESKEKLSNSERSSFGEELLYALSENNLLKKERVFSEYQGFTIILPANMLTDKPYVLIKSKNKGVYFLDMKEVKTPIGCTKSLDYFFENLDKRKDEISKEIHNENQNLRMAKQDLRKGNPYESEVKDLYKKLEVIDYEIENQNKENE